MKRDDNLPAQAMEATEAQIRDAFGAAAGTITAGDLPPRPAPARNSRAARAAWSLRARAPRVRVRALIPVSAAASVTAIAVTAAVVVPGLLNGTPGGALANPAATPRFFAGLTVDRTATGTGPVVTVVKIYRSATGRPVASAKLTVPASQQIQSVSRLGNDRTFVAAAFDRKACVTHFTRFSVSAAGQIQRTTPLSVPRISGDVEQLASSADGKVLAFFLSGCKPPGLQVVAIHLATGQISRWRNASVGGSPSLTADGSVLGFVSGRTIRSQETFAWTIRTDAPAGPLFKRARKVLDLPTNVDDAILSPSGTQLYAETQSGSSRGPLVLNLYRTSTGSLIRQVAHLGPGGQQLSLASLTLDTSARHLLAYGFFDYSLVKAFDLRTGRHFSLSVAHLAIDGALSTLAW
jgi:hypothetical protein